MSVFLSRISLISLRNHSKTLSSKALIRRKELLVPSTISAFNIEQYLVSRSLSSDAIQPTPLIPLKKTIYKKPALEDVIMKDGHYLTLAYVTANSYDLKSLKEALVQQKIYEPETQLKAQQVGDVVIANAVYSVGAEPREILFFREGAVVFWNCTQLEASNVLDFVKSYEIESYPRDVVEKEREVMSYVYQANAKKCYFQESHFSLVPGRDNSLEKYTFSHAMTQSARLGAWEARLEALGASVRAHTRSMEVEGTAHLDKKEVTRKLGELFSLRHRLNVESDLLDIPDFYWEQEELERLYSNTVAYFTIPRRIRVLNERLSHCVELLQLLSSWAADRHHVRLEWMVIALILAEVCFELLHCFERYCLDARSVTRSVHPRRAPFASDVEEAVFQELSIIDI